MLAKHIRPALVCAWNCAVGSLALLMGLTGTLGLFIENTGRTLKHTACLVGLAVCHYQIVYEEEDDQECRDMYDDMR